MADRTQQGRSLLRFLQGPAEVRRSFQQQNLSERLLRKLPYRFVRCRFETLIGRRARSEFDSRIGAITYRL